MHPARRAGTAAVVIAALLSTASVVMAVPGTSAEQFAGFSPSVQRELRAREAVLQVMTPAQRQAFAQRVADWDQLSMAERRIRRERWQAWRALPVDEQWQLRTAAVQFVGLPQAQQQALRAQFAELDGSDRRGWLLGPVLGADYPGIRPLLMQVPANERNPLLAVLRAMTPSERQDLATLAQRTAPQERAALRRELLSTSAANRAAWLRSRLQQ